MIYVKREKADRAARTNVSLPQRINARGPLALEARSRVRNIPTPVRAELIHLQRTVGNLAVLRRLAQRESRATPETVAEPSRPTLPTAGGRPLPESTRGTMESFFNTSFADVRVHVGPEASSIGALAFTHGSNLYFAPGQYNPEHRPWPATSGSRTDPRRATAGGPCPESVWCGSRGGAGPQHGSGSGSAGPRRRFAQCVSAVEDAEFGLAEHGKKSCDPFFRPNYSEVRGRLQSN